MIDCWIVFNAIAYSLSALAMLIFVFVLPRPYKWQYLISVVVFIYYACVNFLSIFGYISGSEVSTFIRPISPVMPLQLIGSVWLVYILLKHIRRGDKYREQHK